MVLLHFTLKVTLQNERSVRNFPKKVTCYFQCVTCNGRYFLPSYACCHLSFVATVLAYSKLESFTKNSDSLASALFQCLLLKALITILASTISNCMSELSHWSICNLMRFRDSLTEEFLIYFLIKLRKHSVNDIYRWV